MTPTPTDPTPPLSPKDQLLADVQALNDIHDQYTAARASLTAAQAAQDTTQAATAADIAAAQAKADQDNAAAKATTDAAQATSDDLHAKTQAALKKLTTDASTFDD